MTTKVTIDRHGVRTDERGYVLYYSCGGEYPRHSGNVRFVHSGVGAHYQCQGCGTFIHAGTILVVQAAVQS